MRHRKTYSARYLSRTLKNCFYVDASQCRQERAFIKELARSVGAELEGTLEDIKASTKYILNILPRPIVIIDEAGCLSYSSLQLLHEFWNGTQDTCGWYMMGADGLRTKLQKGKGKSKSNPIRNCSAVSPASITMWSLTTRLKGWIFTGNLSGRPFGKRCQQEPY